MIVLSPAGPALSLAGPITAHCNLFFVGFLGCASIGTITGYKVAAMELCYCGPVNGVNPADGVTFAGTTSKVFVFATPFEDLSGGSAITLDSTLVADVVDITQSFFKFDAPAAGLTVEGGATVSAGLFEANLFPAANTLTPLVGVTPAATNWWMSDNTGLRDSRVVGVAYLTASALTNIAAANTPVKIAGTTTADSLNERFSHSNNRLTYTGQGPALVQVTAAVSVNASSNNKQFTVWIAKNGSVVTGSGVTVFVGSVADVRAVTSTILVELQTNQYVEAWIENDSDGTDVTAEALTLTVR